MALDSLHKPALFLAKLTKPIARVWHHAARVKVYESGKKKRSNLESWEGKGEGGEREREGSTWESCVRNLIKR